MEGNPAITPTIRLKLGDEWSRVRGQSPDTQLPLELIEDQPVAVQVPHRLIYTRPGFELTLPEGRFTWIDTYADHVCLVRSSPHLAYLEVEQAFELVDTLTGLLGDAHWMVDLSGLPPLEVVRAELRLPRTPPEYAAEVGRWSGGDDRIGLRLSRTTRPVFAPGADRKPIEQYLVTLSINNQEIYTKYDSISKERKASGPGRRPP